MQKKILSIFIDESGDFGAYDFHSPRDFKKNIYKYIEQKKLQ
ncbi:hypothetical protein [Treponema sp. C6A8]|nr:hypothetical protein [Treponema sp. C6A8]